MKHNLNLFYCKIFTKRNFIRIFTIFFAGLFIRILINILLGIDILIDPFNIISFVYYPVMSFLIISTDRFVEFLSLSINGSFSFIFKSFEYIKPFIWKSLFYTNSPFEFKNNHERYFKLSNIYNEKYTKSSCFGTNDNGSDTIKLKDLSKDTKYNIDINSSKISFFSKCKCKLYWILIEKSNNSKQMEAFKKHNTYENFKANWDPDSKLIKDFLENEKNKFKLRKKVLSWIFNRRNPNN